MPELQSEPESIGDLEDCLLRVDEAEFLALLDNLAASMQSAAGG